MSTDRLAPIRSNLQSHDIDTRSRTVRDLITMFQDDASIGPQAWTIFWTVVRGGEPAWQVAAYAARGIETIGGPAHARQAWLELIDRPDVSFAAHVVLYMQDPAYSSDLMSRLESRTEIPMQGAIIQSLGFMKHPASFEPLIARLPIPQLQPAIIEALHRLGDPRAIPYLEPLVSDNADAGIADDRGYPLRVGDLAYRAIAALKRVGVA